jgi:WD40 repeat protein
MRTGEEVAVHDASHRGGIWRMEQSAKGILATASEDHTIGLWDAGGKFLRKLPLGESAYDLSFSADGALLLAARSDWIDLWEVASGKKRFSIPGHGRYGGQRAVAFAAGGAEFCSFGDDFFFRRYLTRNAKTLIEKRLIPTGMDAKKILAGRDETRDDLFFYLSLVGSEFTLDGRTLVLAQRNRIHLFDASTGAEQRYFDTEDVLDHNVMALSPDGRWLFAVAREVPKAKERAPEGALEEPKQFAVIWDLASGKVVRRTPLQERYASRVAFSRDGKHYATVCTDYPRGQRIRIWESAGGAEVRVMDDLPETVGSLLFSPDGRRLYTSLDDTTVVIWNFP